MNQQGILIPRTLGQTSKKGPHHTFAPKRDRECEMGDQLISSYHHSCFSIPLLLCHVNQQCILIHKTLGEGPYNTFDC